MKGFKNCNGEIKRNVLLIVLLQLLFVNVHAQKLPPAYEIKSDTILSQVLDNTYWQMLPDKTGKWTIKDVSNSSFTNSFYRRDSAPKTIDTIANTYWIRYRIKNGRNSNVNFSLDSYSEQDDFYVFDSIGKYKHFLSGHMMPWSKKDGLKLDNYVPLTLTPGEEIIVYDRAYNRVAGLPDNFAVDLVNTAPVAVNDYVQFVEDRQLFFMVSDLENALLIGMLCISLLFNLFFFFTVKEKEYLYFSLLLLSLAIARLVNPAAHYWVITNPLMEEKVGLFNLAWSGITLSMILFVRKFFKLPQRYPRLSIVLVVLGIIIFIFNTVSDLVDPDYLLNVSTHTGWGAIFGTGQGIIYIAITIIF